jgi:hypothetical protein
MLIQKIIISNKLLQEVKADFLLNKRFLTLMEKFFEGSLLATDIDFKKRQQAYTLFSARLNQAGRILFTLEKDEHENLCLFIQDILPTHQYDRAYVLKNLLALKTLDEDTNETLSMLTKENIREKLTLSEVSSSLPSEAPDDSEINDEMPIDTLLTYKNRIVQLDDAQEQIVQCAMPFVICGLPGTGKTLLLKKFIEKLSIESLDEEQQIIYIAPSHLVDEMHNEIIGLNASDSVPKIRCMTYQHFLKEKMTGLKNKEFISKKDVFDFIERSFDKKAFKLLIKPIQDAELQEKYSSIFTKRSNLLVKKFLQYIHEEFSIISSLGNKQNYITAGKKKTTFEIQLRDFIYDLYIKYHSFLTNNELIDETLAINFKTIKPLKNHILLVDEVQLFTANALAFLNAFSQKNIVFACDPRQSLINNRPIMDVLLTLTKNIISLDKIYRCPDSVIRVVQNINHIKVIINGGKTSKIESKLDKNCEEKNTSPIKDHDALCYLSIEKLKENLEIIQTHYLGKVRLAIITDESFKEEAEKTFLSLSDNVEAKLYILTPQQAIGCEWDIIICYRPFDTQVFMDLNKQFLKNIDSDRIFINQPKKKTAISSRLSYLHELVVAMSRSRQSLILVNDDLDAHNKKDLISAILNRTQPVTTLKINVETLKKIEIQAHEEKVDKELLLLDEQKNLTKSDISAFIESIKSFTKKECALIKEENKEEYQAKFYTFLITALQALLTEFPQESAVNIDLLTSPIKSFYLDETIQHSKKSTSTVQKEAKSLQKNQSSKKKNLRKIDILSELNKEYDFFEAIGELSLIHLLALTSEGQKYLETLFEKYKTFYSQLTPQHLFFCHEIKSHPLIPSMIKSQHCLVSLLLSMKSTKKKGKNQSLFLNAQLLQTGHDILLKILKAKNTDDQTLNYHETLEQKVYPLDLPDIQCSIAHLLIRSPHPLLYLAFEKFPKLIEDFDYSILKKREGKTPVSNFLLLCKSREGIKALSKLGEGLIQYVIHEKIIDMLYLLTIEHNNMLQYLMEYPQGIALLNAYLKSILTSNETKTLMHDAESAIKTANLKKLFKNLGKLTINHVEKHLEDKANVLYQLIFFFYQQLYYADFNANLYEFFNLAQHSPNMKLLLASLIKTDKKLFYLSDNSKITFLERIIQHDNIPLLDFVVQAGINVNHENPCREGQTALRVAISVYCFHKSNKQEISDPFEAVKILVENNADIHINNPTSLLYYAVSHQDIKLVKLLLKYGADFNQKNQRNVKNDMTPLELAISYPVVDIAKLLLEQENISIDTCIALSFKEVNRIVKNEINNTISVYLLLQHLENRLAILTTDYTPSIQRQPRIILELNQYTHLTIDELFINYFSIVNKDIHKLSNDKGCPYIETIKESIINIMTVLSTKYLSDTRLTC